MLSQILPVHSVIQVPWKVHQEFGSPSHLLCNIIETFVLSEFFQIRTVSQFYTSEDGEVVCNSACSNGQNVPVLEGRTMTELTVAPLCNCAFSWVYKSHHSQFCHWMAPNSGLCCFSRLLRWSQPHVCAVATYFNVSEWVSEMGWGGVGCIYLTGSSKE